MARIRTIKPEFWSDEKLGPLEPLTRLVFLGLISQADDAGRLIDSVRQLDGLLFPYTDDTCAEALETLARLSRIRRYSSESGQRLIQVEGWSAHQRVDKPSKHVLPPPPSQGVAAPDPTEPSGDSRETVATSPRSDHGPGTMDHGPGSDTHPARVREADELGTWLGDHDRVLDEVTGLTPALRSSLHTQYGPPGMRANAWAKPDGSKVEAAERPRLLTVALSAYLAEKGGRFVANEFAGMLRGLISSEHPPVRGPTPGSEAAEFDADRERWRDVQRRHREFEAQEIRKLHVAAGAER